MDRRARVALLQLPAFSLDRAGESLEHALRRIDDVAVRERPDIIALPEVTYPAYFLGRRDLAGCGLLSPAQAAERFAAKAREHRVYIAAGLVLDAPGGGYTNGALLFGRDGAVIGRYDKSFLWAFDTRWFSPGSAYPVFETDVGRIGILICADARMPEVARSLALGGAQLILDLTAWVSSGRHPAELTTTQVQHLIPVRAMENGVWFACADKHGIEAESIIYAGRSCVVSPRGDLVAALGPDEDAALVYDVPVADAAPPVVRRPELYDVLGWPTERLPVAHAAESPVRLSDTQKRIAVVQMTMPADVADFLVRARRHVERQALMDSDLVLFPAPPSRYRAAYTRDALLPEVQRMAAACSVFVAVTAWEPDGDGYRAMYFVGPGGVVGTHRQTHVPAGDKYAGMPLGDTPAPVLETPLGRVGLMLAAEGFVPEAARSLMLRGAEIVLWAADDPPLPMLPFVAARAEENRIFVAAAAAPTTTGASAVATPDGRISTVALEGAELAMNAEVNAALAHNKQRMPGTDVVWNRQPATYSAITRAVTEVPGAS